MIYLIQGKARNGANTNVACFHRLENAQREALRAVMAGEWVRLLVSQHGTPSMFPPPADEPLPDPLEAFNKPFMASQQ